MIAQGAEEAFGVGEKAIVQVALDHLALDLQAVPGQVGQMIQGVH